ncbi:hypothetical protein CHEID_02770 [Corynebacterium heidelbergense]|nr:hypothetical protein CHEID_02770 [Corynebacterium heidelbergense]
MDGEQNRRRCPIFEGMAYSQILATDELTSLFFECGELPTDEAVFEAGHEPNGYFWQGVAKVVAPEVCEKLEMDSEAGMFSASGSRADLEALQSKLEPVLGDPEAVRKAIEKGEAEGVDFDD